MSKENEIMEIQNEINNIEYAVDKLGETINSFFEDVGTLYEMGKGFYNAFMDCQTQRELDIVEDLLIAICGNDLNSVINEIKERDKSGYAWDSLGEEED